MKHGLLLGLALITLSAPAQEAAGWKTIFATAQDLKDFPAQQISLVDGLLYVRAGNGILIPQPTPDGAIRARFHFREGTTWPQLRLRRSDAAKPQDSEYYEFIFMISPGQTSVNEGRVNFTSKNKVTRLGGVPLPKPFALGDTVDVEFSAVGEHLQVLINGKVAFETNDKSIATGAFWGVSSAVAWYSNVQVRSYSGSLAPAKSNDLRLVQLEEAYAAAIEREVTPVYLEAVKALDAKYAAALDRALEVATQAGNLDSALDLRTEKQRVQDAAPMPEEGKAVSEPLNSLRLTYRKSLSSLTTQRDQRQQPLRDKFLQALDAYQAELTRAKNLDAALEVRKRREQEAPTAR